MSARKVVKTTMTFFQEALAACEASLRKSREFQDIVDILVNVAAIHVLSGPEREVEVDDNLAKQCRRIAAHLAFVGANKTASAEEIAFARKTVHLMWKETTLFMWKEEEGFIRKRLAYGEPWELALFGMFMTGAFVRHLVPKPDGPVTREARAFIATVAILRMLEENGPPELPGQFREAIDAVRGAETIDEVPLPTRHRVENAFTYLLSLTGDVLPPPNDNRIEFRVRWTDLGTRPGGVVWVSPWGAAKGFAACFGVIMKPRLSDAVDDVK